MGVICSGARIVTPDGVLSPGWILIEDGRVSALGQGERAGPGPGTDLGGQWVLPGFVDIHVHGGGGTSFTEGGADDARRAAAFHRRNGSTRIVASLVTAPVDELAERSAMLADLVDEGVIDGIHLEGPFLSHARCGAQDPRYLIDPDLDAFELLRAAARGHLRMITIAPELPGATELIRAAVAAGVVAAVGHTDATAEITAAAVDAGASHATHLFNGMRPLDHKEPGPPGALLDAAAGGRVTCEAISDGTHLHDITIRLIARAGGLVLVTDAMAAAGMPDGDFHLGQQAVTVAGGVARLAEGMPGAGSIAGSTATTQHVVRHAITSAGLPVTDVAAAASHRPARVVGLAGCGALAPGAAADLVVLDDDFRLTGVMARGEWVER
ncbi:MAG TPA: N-acetylglucosamine-6-phosphate deacetylase [Streptosporangiaceae bacterium]|jgi:N-acetylglucosamine-6-phosphate deacetylase